MHPSIEVGSSSIALEPQPRPSEGKINSPEIVEDYPEEFVKNSKAVSSWTIFASALANFSDGYQNNLVRTDLILSRIWP